MTSIIYDVSCVVILVAAFSLFSSRGFLASALKTVSIFAAIGIGFYIAGIMADSVYKTYVYPWLFAKITAKLNDFVSGITVDFGSGFIGKAIEDYLSSMELTSDLDATAEKIIAGSLENISLTVVRIGLFLVSFLILFLVLKLLVKLMERVNDVPLIGGINKLLGGIFGLAVGLFILIILGWLFNLLMKNFNISWMTEDIIQSTYVFSLLYNNNPLIR